jgi:hypothetical protein
MSLELPPAVVLLLQFLGLTWPSIDEDKVRAVGDDVAQFARRIQESHDDATSTIRKMGSSYQSASYEQLATIWAETSKTHMADLVAGCETAAAALWAASDFIIAQKWTAIGELTALAAAFAADQAAAVETAGMAEAAVALIDVAAERVLYFLYQQVQQYIQAQVIEIGFKQLEPVVDRALKGFVLNALPHSPAAPPAGSPSSGGLTVDTHQLRTDAQTMRGHADKVSGHAGDLINRISGVRFGE